MNCCWAWLIIAFLVFLALFFFWVGTPVTTFNGKRFNVTLDGSQEVPSIPTPASGNGNVVVSGNREYVDYNFTVTNLTSPVIAAHFHRGARGVNGPIVKNLEFTRLEGNNSYALRGRWSRQDAAQPLTNDLVNDLLNGQIYVNVHTTQYPDGEIRGQVE